MAEVTLGELCTDTGQSGTYCTQISDKCRLYHVVRYSEEWRGEADVVRVVPAWWEGETPLWKDISHSELKSGAEPTCHGLEEKISSYKSCLALKLHHA